MPRKILKEMKFPKQRGTVPLSIVLAEVEGGHPYVTWMRNDEDNSVFWGEYFRKDQYVDAELSFLERAERLFDQCRAQGLVSGTFAAFRASV